MIEGLGHVGTDHVCTVCSCDYTDDEGGIEGFIGILPAAFCPTCFAGICDMVEQLTDERDWEGLTMEELREIAPIWFERETSLKDFVEIIEEKLKEKNHDRE